jgi:RNA exonuclease 4
MKLSPNWEQLKATLNVEVSSKRSQKQSGYEQRSLKRKQPSVPVPKSGKKLKLDNPIMNGNVATERVNEGLSEKHDFLGKYVAIDCEMVGVGPEPDRESALARVSIVDYNGEQVYDSYVRPKELVTDWRTPVSGISSQNMQEARSLEQVQTDVSKILNGNILVGHSVRNDLDALLLGHPKRDIRDTAQHPPFRKLAGGSSPRLKILAAEILGIEIQSGAHSSVEDARATMLLFRREKEAFEREHAKKWPSQTGSSQKKPSQKKRRRKR